MYTFINKATPTNYVTRVFILTQEPGSDTRHSDMVMDTPTLILCKKNMSNFQNIVEPTLVHVSMSDTSSRVWVT